jgi:hypothetical protein
VPLLPGRHVFYPLAANRLAYNICFLFTPLDQLVCSHRKALGLCSKTRLIKMTSYIVKMIWVYLFTYLIAANAGATIITETHITTTKIAMSAQLDTRSLGLAPSDSEITLPDAISIDVSTPGTGADKGQISNNTTAISVRSSNRTSSNGSIAGLNPGVIGLTASTTVSNGAALSKGKDNGSTQQPSANNSPGSTSVNSIPSSGSKNPTSSGLSSASNSTKPATIPITTASPSNSVALLNTTMLAGTPKITSSVSLRKSASNATTFGPVTDLSRTARNSSQSILSTTRMTNTTISGTGLSAPSSSTSNSSATVLSSSQSTHSNSPSANNTSGRSSRNLTATGPHDKPFTAFPLSSGGSEDTTSISTESSLGTFTSLRSNASISKMPTPKATDAGNQLTTTKPSSTDGKGSVIISQTGDTSGGGGGGGGGGGDDEDEDEDDDDDEDDGGGDDEDSDDDDDDGGGGNDDKPNETIPEEEPDDKKSSSQSLSQSECETKTATHITAFCNIVTQVPGSGNGSSATSAPRTTCTSTKEEVTQGCSVKGTTTSEFDSCSQTQTATEFTKYCTESVSDGKTYTPCTKTVSTVFEGCSVTATTTSVIDEACHAMVTFAPDDPQGEFGSLPPQNDTCPYLSSVNISPSDDQGQDGMKGNGTCPIWNGTRPSFDNDQGSDEPRTCSMSNDTMVLELGFLDQGQDGFLNQSCPIGTDLTIVVDAEQGEDGNAEQNCPAIPEGVIITPLADQGTYESTNASCPLLNPRFPISPMDEQSDDWDPQVKEIPDDPPEKSYSELTNPCAPPTSSRLGKCSTVFPKKFPAQATGVVDVKRLVSCACESQTKGQTVEISNVCGTPMCPNSVRTVTGIAAPTKPPITTDSFVHSEQTSEYSYPPITCNCDVPTIPELSACSRKTKAGTPNPGANPMAWGGAHDITFCGCESGSRSHAGTTVCDQFVCPNDPELETPTPCPRGACAWPTNEKLGKCSSKTAVLSTDGGPVRTFGYCECEHHERSYVRLNLYS